LNSSGQGGLYQDVAVQSGAQLDWEFWHRGRSGTDTIELQIGDPSDPEVVFTASTGADGWARYQGSYTVPSDLTVVRVMLWSTQSGSRGNLVDRVSVISR